MTKYVLRDSFLLMIGQAVATHFHMAFEPKILTEVAPRSLSIYLGDLGRFRAESWLQPGWEQDGLSLFLFHKLPITSYTGYQRELTYDPVAVSLFTLIAPARQTPDDDRSGVYAALLIMIPFWSSSHSVNDSSLILTSCATSYILKLKCESLQWPHPPRAHVKHRRCPFWDSSLSYFNLDSFVSPRT